MLIDLLDKIILVLGLASIVCITIEKRIGWLLAIFASLISSFLYLQSHIYLHSILSLYYAGISLYGYITWNPKRSIQVYISEYKLKTHGFIIVPLLLASIIYAKIINTYVPSAQYAFFDAVVFLFAIVANFMQVKKIVSNWLYWIILDSIMLIINIKLQLYGLSLLYAVYTSIAVVGFVRYFRKFKANKLKKI